MNIDVLLAAWYKLKQRDLHLRKSLCFHSVNLNYFFSSILIITIRIYIYYRKVQESKLCQVPLPTIPSITNLLVF